MGYEEDIVKYLLTLEVGQLISRTEIIERVNYLYGTNKTSIIPSDYCYNRVNLDKTAHDFKNGHPRLLEWVKKGLYKYLGPNYNYTGKIYHKNKNSNKDCAVGEWNNGEYVFYKSF